MVRVQPRPPSTLSLQFLSRDPITLPVRLVASTSTLIYLPDILPSPSHRRGPSSPPNSSSASSNIRRLQSGASIHYSAGTHVKRILLSALRSVHASKLTVGKLTVGGRQFLDRWASADVSSLLRSIFRREQSPTSTTLLSAPLSTTAMSTDTLLPPSPSPTSSLPDLYEIGGTPAYLAKRDTMRQRLYDKLPKDVLLPQSVLDSHPLNVTGVPASCGLLTARELAITALDATDVRDKVAAGDLTAVEVVSAFGRRAAIAQQVTCCTFPPSLVLARPPSGYSDIPPSHRLDGLLPRNRHCTSSSSRRPLRQNGFCRWTSTRRSYQLQGSHPRRWELGDAWFHLQPRGFDGGRRRGQASSVARSGFLRQNESASGSAHTGVALGFRTDCTLLFLALASASALSKRRNELTYALFASSSTRTTVFSVPVDRLVGRERL